MMSLALPPRPTQGSLTLTPENVRARINRSRSVSPSSLEKPRDESQMDKVMPALSSKLSYLSFFPFLLLPFLPSSHAHRHRPLLYRGRRLPVLRPSSANALPSNPATSSSSVGLTSPIMPSMPMQPMLAFVTSPDDMLCAYAERKAAGFGGSITTAPILFQRPIQVPVADERCEPYEYGQ